MSDPQCGWLLLVVVGRGCCLFVGLLVRGFVGLLVGWLVGLVAQLVGLCALVCYCFPEIMFSLFW